MMAANTFYKYESFDFMMIMIRLRNDINHATRFMSHSKTSSLPVPTSGHKFPAKTEVLGINRQIMRFP